MLNVDFELFCKKSLVFGNELPSSIRLLTCPEKAPSRRNIPQRHLYDCEKAMRRLQKKKRRMPRHDLRRGRSHSHAAQTTTSLGKAAPKFHIICTRNITDHKEVYSKRHANKCTPTKFVPSLSRWLYGGSATIVPDFWGQEGQNDTVTLKI
jgi:hypothetical protein